jgi:DnaK suppressor protein
MARNETPNAERTAELTRLLTQLRNRTLARVHDWRREQGDDVVPPPADEMDFARSLADVETHASLIERAEDVLKSIDDALRRLEEGNYGVCESCGEDITVERLRAVPFATYCIECQTEINHAANVGRGSLSGDFRRRWSIPQEVDESFEAQDAMVSPEEETMVHQDRPFGPEEGPGPIARQPRRRGRPPRKGKAK